MSCSADDLVNPVKYRVLVVDDHPLVRCGLSELISQEPNLVVCGEADSIPEALRLVKATQPHVIIVDISLKGGTGIDLIERVMAEHSRITLLVCSMHDELLFAERTLRAGAKGYVNKQEATETMIDAIHHVIRGEVWLSPRMRNRLLQFIVSGDQPMQNPIEGLSNRELEIFEMIGQGMTIKQIAGHLRLSPKTVESHRARLKVKLNATNSTELTHCAVQWVLEGR